MGCSSLGYSCEFVFNTAMQLINLPINVQARMVEFAEVRVKLNQYGLFVGDIVKVVRVAPMGGPILVEVNGREVALGRTLAKKITVELI